MDKINNNNNNNNTRENVLSLKKIFKLYLFPLISLSIFFVSFTFFVIPKISFIFEKLDRIEQLKHKFEQNNKTILELINLSSSVEKIYIYLENINKIAPQESFTSVVAFRNKIISLANKHNLDLKLQRFSENLNLLGTLDTDSNTMLVSLREIPSYFEIEGEYDSLLSFINDISAIEEFVIIKKMDLFLRPIDFNTKSRTNAELSKYFFYSSENDLEIKNFYKNISIFERPNKIVVDYLDRIISKQENNLFINNNN